MKSRATTKTAHQRGLKNNVDCCTKGLSTENKWAKCRLLCSHVRTHTFEWWLTGNLCKTLEGICIHFKQATEKSKYTKKSHRPLFPVVCTVLVNYSGTRESSEFQHGLLLRQQVTLQTNSKDTMAPLLSYLLLCTADLEFI